VRSSLGKRFKARSSRFTWLLTIKLANAPLSLTRKRDCDENRSAGALLRATAHASSCSQVCDYNRTNLAVCCWPRGRLTGLKSKSSARFHLLPPVDRAASKTRADLFLTKCMLFASVITSMFA